MKNKSDWDSALRINEISFSVILINVKSTFQSTRDVRALFPVYRPQDSRKDSILGEELTRAKSLLYVSFSDDSTRVKRERERRERFLASCYTLTDNPVYDDDGLTREITSGLL